MALNLEDYFRTIFEDTLIIKTPVVELRTGATRTLEKINEIKVVECALATQRKEFELKVESLRRFQRRQDEKEEHLKDSLLKFNKFLKENDRKYAQALKKACMERELSQQKQDEIKDLEQESIALEKTRQQLQIKVHKNAIYKDFLLQVTKNSKKFGDIWELVARFETLLANREQLLRKESKERELAEVQCRQQRRLVEEQSDYILQCNNQLSYLQTCLDQIRSTAFKWETKLKHIQLAAAKETVLLGQMKVVTLNLFQMIGGQTGGKTGVCVDDTMEQLERIKLFIQDQTSIVHELRRACSEQNASTV